MFINLFLLCLADYTVNHKHTKIENLLQNKLIVTKVGTSTDIIYEK